MAIKDVESSALQRLKADRYWDCTEVAAWVTRTLPKILGKTAGEGA